MPSTQAQISTTIEQWEADLLHDTRDRLAFITSPTLVVAGQQDILTPASQGCAVADMIPAASIEILSGPGSSHALAFERPEEFTPLVVEFLRDHPLPTTPDTTTAALPPGR